MQTWLAFLTMPSSTSLICPQKALHTMLGYRRPPDHKRTRLPQCWKVGITAVFPLVSYRFCVTYSSIPSSLPRPLNSLSPRIHSILTLADRPHPFLRPSFYKTNASPTSMIVPSFLGPPWPARPGHLHPVVHRLTKGPHTYIDHLIGCAQRWGYSVIILHPLLRTSRLRHLRRSMCHYIHGIPPSGPNLYPQDQKIIVSGYSVHTA